MTKSLGAYLLQDENPVHDRELEAYNQKLASFKSTLDNNLEKLARAKEDSTLVKLEKLRIQALETGRPSLASFIDLLIDKELSEFTTKGGDN